MNGLDWPFGTPWSLVAYPLFIQNFWMAWAGSLGPDWLMVTWSLAALEQFYLVLPWVLKLGQQSRATFPMLAGLILLAPLCRAIVASTVPLSKHFGWDCLLICRTDSLCLGVLVAFASRTQPWQPWIARAAALYGPLALALLVGFACLTCWRSASGLVVRFVAGHTYLSVFYLAIILAVTFQKRGFLARVCRTRLLREAGRISFGLFLFHQAAHILVHGLLFGFVMPLTDPEGLCATILALFLTAGTAELSWRYIERPVINWTRAVSA